MGKEQSILEGLSGGILEGDKGAAVRWAREAVGSGVDPSKAIDVALLPAIRQVGERFSSGDCFLPELIRAGEAMKEATRILEDEITRRGMKRKSKGTVVLGTVAGDLHDIGKSIVGSLLSANAFRVVDIGYDAPDQRFIDAVKEHKPHALGISCLLTTCLPRMKEVMDMLAEAGLREGLTAMVGGSCVNQAYADFIGADIYAVDAADGVVKLSKAKGGS